MERILVWDWPTRIGHWLMALSFLVAYLTGDSETWRLVHVFAGGTLATEAHSARATTVRNARFRGSEPGRAATATSALPSWRRSRASAASPVLSLTCTSG